MKRTAWAAGTAAALALLGCRPSRVPFQVDAQRQAREQLAVLDEIFRSKNDNDPRLDTGFDHLALTTRKLMREKYRDLPVERRNERGTIVYLLGRAPSSREDWDFLRAVAGEQPCLSLADCSREPLAGEDYAARGDEVTLAYPSLVALRQTQKYLEAAPSDGRALAVLEAGAASKSPAVSRLAARIRRHYLRDR